SVHAALEPVDALDMRHLGCARGGGGHGRVRGRRIALAGGEQRQRDAECEAYVHGIPPPQVAPSVTSGARALCGSGRICSPPSTSTKNNGTKKMARKVEASMPPITPVPTAFCAPEPAPLAMASGSTPNMKASEVIRMGRRR